MPIRLSPIFLLLLLVPLAHAWSYKEHIQLTRIAVMRIVADPSAPAELRQWLTQTTPTLSSMDAELSYLLDARVGINPDPATLRGLTWWVCVPDLEAANRNGRPVEPFGSHERLMHYIDLEYFAKTDSAGAYRDDLSNKPRVTDIPRDFRDGRFERAGYLPFAVQRSYDELVRTIRSGRLKPDTQRIEDQDHALRWAGYLAHYVQDNTQPHHATVDFRSASYFDHVRTAPNIHAEMEWKLVDDPEQPLPELRREYWQAFVGALELGLDPVDESDLFIATIETARHSYDALPLIGAAARAAWDGSRLDTEKFYRHRGPLRGTEIRVFEMKAVQTALAVLRTERLLRRAWDRATR